MKEHEIGPNDVVIVSFQNSQSVLCHKATVIHQPENPGESWIFKDLETGIIHYVSEGCTVTKRKKRKIT